MIQIYIYSYIIIGMLTGASGGREGIRHKERARLSQYSDDFIMWAMVIFGVLAWPYMWYTIARVFIARIRMRRAMRKEGKKIIYDTIKMLKDKYGIDVEQEIKNRKKNIS